MKKKTLNISLLFFTIALIIIGSGSGSGNNNKIRLPTNIPHTPITGVPKPVNDLGMRIAQEQRLVVTPGGNEWAPGFSSANEFAFEKSDRLKKIVNRVKSTKTFTAGVASIRTLSKSDQARVFDAYAKPLYPTWRMNGRIDSKGTTDAGYAVEKKIANALTDAVKAAL